jgi:hypothetical protein
VPVEEPSTASETDSCSAAKSMEHPISPPRCTYPCAQPKKSVETARLTAGRRSLRISATPTVAVVKGGNGVGTARVAARAKGGDTVRSVAMGVKRQKFLWHPVWLIRQSSHANDCRCRSSGYLTIWSPVVAEHNLSPQKPAKAGHRPTIAHQTRRRIISTEVRFSIHRGHQYAQGF